MKIVLRISRFTRGVDATPHDQDYPVVVEPTERILDALLRVKRHQDGSISFRASCAHGVCGSDAMVINGTERLACKTLVRDVAAGENAVVTLQPLRHLPVERDLIVNQGVFFEKHRSVKPFFINDEPAGGRERPQSQQERLAFDEMTACILCGACYSACPVLDANPRYVGPAAIVQAARFLFDSRDRGAEARRAVLGSPDGARACENHFTCTRVCPREIKVTKTINATKRLIAKTKEGGA